MVEGLSNMKEHYAHSDNSQDQRHRLDDRPQEVAALSRKIADKFNSADLTYYVEIWHDLGKYSR